MMVLKGMSSCEDQSSVQHVEKLQKVQFIDFIDSCEYSHSDEVSTVPSTCDMSVRSRQQKILLLGRATVSIKLKVKHSVAGRALRKAKESLPSAARQANNNTRLKSNVPSCVIQLENHEVQALDIAQTLAQDIAASMMKHISRSDQLSLTCPNILSDDDGLSLALEQTRFNNQNRKSGKERLFKECYDTRVIITGPTMPTKAATFARAA